MLIDMFVTAGVLFHVTDLLYLILKDLRTMAMLRMWVIPQPVLS